MARAEVVLFTGAGFSWGATDLDGRPIPQPAELRDELWHTVWPDDPVDDGSTLADTYAAALAEARRATTQLMRRRLTVDPASVTEAHAEWLSKPWRRAYTLNVDDLELACERQHPLPRPMRPHSALAGQLPLGTGADLLYVHLNGGLEDLPDVTFADPQYGRRHAASNPMYEQLAAELLSFPVIFVGTQLRESLLWEYIALRDQKGARGVREMRPLSYLVTPELPRDRQRLLQTYNVQWVPATTDSFATEVLARLSAASRDGHRMLGARPHARDHEIVLPAVSELSSLPEQPVSEYLLGARPTWGDIRAGRAVEREFEAEIDTSQRRGTMLITGTASAGTTTTLMRLALRLVADGRDVRWLDADQDLDAIQLGRYLRNLDDDVVVVLDDADTFGRRLETLIADVDAAVGDVLLIMGLRSARVTSVLRDWTGTRIDVPLLGNDDIDLLLDALDQDNKLGELALMSYPDRQERIRRECGRELIVAMIEATSGERFEAKIAEEYDTLGPEQQVLYAILALATEMRHYLTRDEVLMASGDLSNTALYALDRLVAARLITAVGGRYTVRHRRIAEMLLGRLRGGVQLLEPYRGVLRTMATRYDATDRRARETRLLTALISHSRILRTFAVSDARTLYQEVEELCRDDYHFWLQRGSLEVESGSLPLARTWLAQARAGGGEHDFRVHTEWAYYLIKSAARNPSATDSFDKVDEGERILLEQIDAIGGRDNYPWHVYGSQMLSWLRRAPLGEDERARRLEGVLRKLEDGLELHRGNRELTVLRADVEKQWLLTQTR
jgi:hypothetical protein